MREGKHHDRLTPIEYALGKEGAYISYVSGNILMGDPLAVEAHRQGHGNNSVVFILMMSGKLDYARNVIAWGGNGLLTRLDRGKLEDHSAIKLLRPRVARVRLFAFWIAVLFEVWKQRLKAKVWAPDRLVGRRFMAAREDAAAWDEGARKEAGL